MLVNLCACNEKCKCKTQRDVNTYDSSILHCVIDLLWID